MPINSLFRGFLLLIAVPMGLSLAGRVVHAQDSTGAPPPTQQSPAPPPTELPATPEQPIAPAEEQPADPAPAEVERAARVAPPPPPSSRPRPQADPPTPIPQSSADPVVSVDAPAGRESSTREAFRRILVAAADSSGPVAPIGPLAPMAPTLRGMVWQRPDSLDAALDDLLEMRRVGVGVVRTGVIEDTLLLRAADVLGLAFYQDLPVANLPARHLLDTLNFAERTLTEMLLRAQRFRSARHFGLARNVDTSNPDARPYFERLAQLVRERAPEGSQTYYLSRFPDDDRCDQTVDFVLLDARSSGPAEVLRRWRVRHDTPAGIGSFGAPLKPGTEGGWREAGTLSAQARALETGLGVVLGLSPQPATLFVFRWADADGRLGAMDPRAEAEGVVYGLNGPEGDSLARPALDVVRGFFTGTQRVFAFDAGDVVGETQTATGMVVVGWLLLMGMGMVFWLTPRFGFLSSRYFTRHDLYRESIQRGYDLNAGLNAMLGVSLSLAGAVAGASVLRALGRTDALSAAVSSWSLEAQARVNQLLGEPLLLVSLLGLCYGLWLLSNIFWMFLLAGRRHRIRAQQALTLVVWSRWAIVVLMVCAMVLSATSPRAATALAPLLFLVWVGVEIIATGRMLNDFGHVTRVPLQRALLLGFGAPLGVIVVILLVLFMGSRAELGFLWHLATRS